MQPQFRLRNSSIKKWLLFMQLFSGCACIFGAVGILTGQLLLGGVFNGIAMLALCGIPQLISACLVLSANKHFSLISMISAGVMIAWMTVMLILTGFNSMPIGYIVLGALEIPAARIYSLRLAEEAGKTNPPESEDQ